MYFSLNVVAVFLTVQTVSTFHQFPERNVLISKQDRDILNAITEEELRRFCELGNQTVDRQLRLEENLHNSEITVKNGSLSHKQLLETLPNSKANGDNLVATKILKSSLFIYNTRCVEFGISGSTCRDFFSEKSLPQDTLLWKQCNTILQEMPNGQHALRRLLPSNYQDGFYKMYSGSKLPAARLVSSQTLHGLHVSVVIGNEALDEGQRNLAFLQWAQFVEHDLSKPVARSMRNGDPIECCNHENYKLQPRHLHPACAPLIGKDSSSPYGRDTCLSYVRSALTVGSDCNFGGAKQLNQATAYLDLSQIYGQTSSAQEIMRTHRFGKIKSSQSTANVTEDMLPLATSPYAFCSLKLEAQNETCFMAGDSRVNSNPYSIVLYTLFMRSHNKIAQELHKKHSEWNDDQLYEAAKAINIAVYRNVVLKEWLPTVLGREKAANIRQNRDTLSIRPQISNEFAVAGIRFYFSMMPNVVEDLTLKMSTESSTAQTRIDNNNTSPPNLFLAKDEMYRSRVLTNSMKLNNVLESLLHQRAMRMDSNYAESFIQSYMGTSHPTRSDVLAFDIQRGRDHGLQGYVKYLEHCEGISIQSWDDLESYIDANIVNKLKTAYDNWNDVDLIVGGISEKTLNDATVGPTFTCILGEQFSKIHQWHQVLENKSNIDDNDMKPYLSWTGAQFLCANSQVKSVPKNVFEIDSNSNPMIACQDALRMDAQYA